MSAPVRIEVTRTTAAFEAIVPQWSDLWQSDSSALPFQRPEWLLPWWHHFGQQALRVLTLWRGDALQALIPLYIYPDPVSGERQLLLLGAGTTDYLDGIFSSECAAEDVVAGLQLLRAEADWDVAHLTQLRSRSLLLQAVQAAEFTGSTTSYAGESCSQCRAVPVRDLPSRMRADVRYLQNAAGGRGVLELTAADDASWREIFGLLVQFHTARWQQAGEPGVLADPAVLAWHGEAVPRLLESGLLRLLLLRARGEPLAALYSLVDPPGREGRTQYFYLSGYSPDHGRLQPGTLLTGLAIERAAEEGIVKIDMLRGNESYKKFWHVERVPTAGFVLRRT